jgi:4-diphosphocytidyl-2-C-methyl-D-erythritol kinase
MPPHRNDPMSKSEFAPAKINLTLEVLGRRSDGYHELRSLVAFAQDVGDVLTLEPGIDTGVDTSGPFAGSIVGGNLVDKAIRAFTAKFSNVTPARISLQKNLPVASGVGGGSADAAAVLRLLSANHPAAPDVDLWQIARELGADVPVCLNGRCVVMTGTGERLTETTLPGGLSAILANPLVGVSSDKTARVFAKLGARPLTDKPRAEQPPRFSNADDVISYAEARGNDLEPPARSLLPVIGTMLAEIRRLDNNRLAQLSGAGPTCFALFDTEQQAKAAASTLQQRQPNWWIRPTRLG